MTFVTLLSVRLRTKCRTFFFLRETATNSEKANTRAQIRFNNDSRTQSTFNNTFGHSSAPPDTQKTEIQAKCRTCYVTNLMLIRKIYQCSLYCLSYVKFDVRPWPKVISYINSSNLNISFYAIDHTFCGFTGVITRDVGRTRELKLVNHQPKASDLQAFRHFHGLYSHRP